MDHLLTLPLSPVEIALAKVLASGFVILVEPALSLYVVVEGLLAIPISGSVPLFPFRVAPYLFSTLSVGVFLAVPVRSMPQFGLLFMLVFLLVFLPMQMLSGGNTSWRANPGCCKSSSRAWHPRTSSAYSGRPSCAGPGPG